MTRKAIYGGSFDPPTWRHKWMIYEAASLFDEVVILLADNPDKKPFLSVQDRLELLTEITKGIRGVSVDYLSGGFLADYAKEHEVEYLIRGIRNTNDFVYEKDLKEINDDLGSYYLRSVYFIPPANKCHISSSLVRGLVKIEGWKDKIEMYVPPNVGKLLKDML